MLKKLMGIINVDFDATAEIIIIQGKVTALKNLYKYKVKYLMFPFDSPTYIRLIILAELKKGLHMKRKCV